MQISAAHAVIILREAFHPLCCGASVESMFEDTVTFSVVTRSGEPVVSPKTLSTVDFGRHDSLEELIVQVRADISSYQGIRLDPWKMSV